MPYIICVNMPGYLPESDPYAVATLAEASEEALDIIWRVEYSSVDPEPDLNAAREMPAAGGVIGPLPDGYVIDVTRVELREIDAELLPAITSVWSQHGHRFMSTDCDEHDSCLTCGAMFELVRREDDLSAGDYVSSSGDEPMQCTHDTAMVHGDPGEQDHGLDCADGCEHCRHDCNCLFCA